jgi:hypothetical protein
MLIFKNNIYDPKETGFAGFSKSPDLDYDSWFDPRHFVEAALSEEDEIFSFIEKQPREYWREDTQKFYPRSGQIGNLGILEKILKILQTGLADKKAWYQMNTYHFCFLYDTLVRFAFNYNHDNQQERLNTLPELKGKPIQIELFVRNYFYNTVFLLDEDKFDSLSREEKLKRGFNCPCQFGVVHGLIPTEEEMALKESRDYPYSIYV